MAVSVAAKPCPFCGAQPEILFEPKHTGFFFKRWTHNIWMLKCLNRACYAKPCVTSLLPNSTLGDAVERWNRRPQ